MKNRTFHKSDIFVVIFLILQIGLWTKTKTIKPDLSIVPNIPSEQSVRALSLGDEQFYFRTLAFRLQNMGDTFGRFTALKDYDFKKLYHWFKLLDILDSKSNFVPSISAYYFSQTQNVPDVRYVINYLKEHSENNLKEKWWWLGQATHLANHKLDDKDLALELSYLLTKTPGDDLPAWVKQMPAFILEKKGEEEQAMAVVCDIIKNSDNLDQGELNFMTHFVLTRLDKRYKDLSQSEQIKKLVHDCPYFEIFNKNTLSGEK